MCAAIATPPSRPAYALWEKPTLRETLSTPGNFVTAVELVTTRGVISDKGGKNCLDLARAMAGHPRVQVLSITDNPGGNAMLSADVLGTDLISRGQEVIIHLSCKDWNRNALQSRAWKLASEGFRNVLALSGDYPVDGYEGQASPVFDIDSIGLLNMFSAINKQLGPNGEPLGPAQSPTGKYFYLGAAVTNHKLLEDEVMPQYFKLAKKIRAGAEFIIAQIGYDSRKQDELLKYMRLHEMNAPILYNVFVLSRGAARVFHSGRIPGCVVTDELLARAEKEFASLDKGKAFFLELAAKQCAIGRGLGYNGVYIGGHLRAADYEKIFALVDTFSPDDWRIFTKEILYSQPGEFFYFEPNRDTGLSSTEVNREYLKSISPEGRKAARSKVPLSYRINRTVHSHVFEPGGALFNLGKKFYSKLEKMPKLSKMAHNAEQMAKIPMFDCRDCGDCSLPDIAYLCPESQCAKNQRNGPCGGTRQGKCEVSEKQCIWALAYDRLKPYGEEQVPYESPVVIKNGALKHTSAWGNTFLERDHHAKLRAAAQKESEHKPNTQPKEKKA